MKPELQEARRFILEHSNQIVRGTRLWWHWVRSIRLIEEYKGARFDDWKADPEFRRMMKHWNPQRN